MARFAVLVVAGALGASLLSGCTRVANEAGAAGGDAGVAAPLAPPETLRALAPFEDADPVGALRARVAPRPGTCAQVRALPDRAAADAVAADIRAATGLAVEVLQADLGPRGIWFRVCVGNEDSVARIVARATRWTAPGGTLERFLDAQAPNEARFLVHERPVVDPRTATPVQARALLLRTAAPGPPPPAVAAAPPTSEPVPVAGGTPAGASPATPSPTRPTPGLVPVVQTMPSLGGGDFDVVFAGTFERPLVATTSTPAPSSSAPAWPHVVVVDVEGRVLPFDPSPSPECASCAVAEQRSPVVSRRVIGSGDVLPAPGAELIVEEETGDGTRILTVVQAADGTLRRQGGVLLAQSTPGIVLRGEAAVVEGDGDDDREVAVSRLELRFDGGNLCSLATRAEVWSTPQAAQNGLARVDVMTLARGPGGDSAALDFITAVDAAGDRDAGSRACARVLAQTPGTLVTQLCLQRVRALIAEHRLVDAVNAAGTLSEGTPALRAAVAAPLFDAMSALDADPRLSATPWDCASSPLVAGATTPTSQVLAQARARLQERVGLADVVDAAFVTAARDFGPDTPVGQIASRWLERLRSAQPARHAAIEALLLPPPTATTAAVSTAGSTASPAGGVTTAAATLAPPTTEAKHAAPARAPVSVAPAPAPAPAPTPAPAAPRESPAFGGTP